jgi:hypothetical protein
VAANAAPARRVWPPVIHVTLRLRQWAAGPDRSGGGRRGGRFAGSGRGLSGAVGSTVGEAGSEQQNGTAPYAAGFDEPVCRFRLVGWEGGRDAEREDAGLGLVA